MIILKIQIHNKVFPSDHPDYDKNRNKIISRMQLEWFYHSCYNQD